MGKTFIILSRKENPSWSIRGRDTAEKSEGDTMGSTGTQIGEAEKKNPTR